MAAAAVLAGGCKRNPSGEQGPTGDEIVLRVGERAITLREFVEDFERAKHERGITGDPAASAVLRDALVAEVIKRELILRHARAAGISVQAEEVAAEIGRIRAHYPGESFREMLAEQYVAYDEWIERQKMRLLVEKVIAEELQHKTAVSDEEAKAWFEAHPAIAHEPERVRVRQIMVATEAEARLIRSRLDRGEDFATLAREKSIGPEGRDGGDIGVFSPGEVPEVMNVVFTLKDGRHSDVVQSEYGFHIFQLVERTPERVLTFEQVKPLVAERVRAEAVQAAFPGWLRDLANGVKVERNDALLAAVE